MGNLGSVFGPGAGDFPGFIEMFSHFLSMSDNDPVLREGLMEYYANFETDKKKADKMPQSGDQAKTDAFVKSVCKAFPHAAEYSGYKSKLNVYLYVVEFGPTKAQRLAPGGVSDEKKLMAQSTRPLESRLEKYARQVADAFLTLDSCEQRQAAIRPIGQAINDNTKQLLVCHRASFLGSATGKPVDIREMEHHWDGCGGWMK
ncbi:MAG: hypothetical protein LBV00_00965 [Propionibacteriaceae bacterium]|nr:hypothetical protein [Propionibacteriaceae bacterium]